MITKKILTWLLPAFFIAGIYSCKQSRPSKKHVMFPGKDNRNYQKKNFDSLVNQVEKGLPTELDIYDQYLDQPAFVEILEHNPVYFHDMVDMMTKKKFTPVQAEICIFAMQNLDVKNYVDLCRMYAELYAAHRISEGMLTQVFIPPFLDRRIIIDHYDDPDVIAVLHFIHELKISRRSEETIEEILDGKISRDLAASD
jgi:hypothetical protein